MGRADAEASNGEETGKALNIREAVMTIRSPKAKTLAHRTFRLLVGISSGFLILWIGVVGIVAVVVNPYLIAALWILGFAGLFACAGACVNTFPSPGEGSEAPHPARAIFCLLCAVAIGMALWSVAYTGMDGEPLGLRVFSVIMALGVMLGLVTLFFFWLSLFLSGREEDERTRVRVREKGIIELPVQKATG